MGAGKEEYKAAANKLPSNRTPAEQALVDDAYSNGMVDITNLDHAAGGVQKYGA